MHLGVELINVQLSKMEIKGTICALRMESQVNVCLYLVNDENVYCNNWDLGTEIYHSSSQLFIQLIQEDLGSKSLKRN